MRLSNGPRSPPDADDGTSDVMRVTRSSDLMIDITYTSRGDLSMHVEMTISAHKTPWEAKSCFRFSVQISKLNKQILSQYFGQSRRKDSVIFTLLFYHFHFCSVSLLYYTLVLSNSTLQTTGYAPTGTSRIYTDLDDEDQRKMMLFKKMLRSRFMNLVKFNRLQERAGTILEYVDMSTAC